MDLAIATMATTESESSSSEDEVVSRKRDNDFSLINDGDNDAEGGTLPPGSARSYNSSASSRWPFSSVTSSYGITMGYKGHMHKKQRNPRSKVEGEEKRNKAFQTFATRFFNGNVAEARKQVELFQSLPEGTRYSFLMPYVHRKSEPLSQSMCKTVFRCGANAWQKAKNGETEKRVAAVPIREDRVTDTQLAQIHRMLDPSTLGGLPLELGFACAHRKQMKSATTAKTWEDVYAFYVAFEGEATDLKKMASSTFFKKVKAYERDFRLAATKLDACDVCERIKMELKEMNLGEEERAQLQKELKTTSKRRGRSVLD